MKNHCHPFLSRGGHTDLRVLLQASFYPHASAGVPNLPSAGSGVAAARTATGKGGSCWWTCSAPGRGTSRRWAQPKRPAGAAAASGTPCLLRAGPGSAGLSVGQQSAAARSRVSLQPLYHLGPRATPPPPPLPRPPPPPPSAPQLKLDLSFNADPWTAAPEPAAAAGQVSAMSEGKKIFPQCSAAEAQRMLHRLHPVLPQTSQIGGDWEERWEFLAPTPLTPASFS